MRFQTLLHVAGIPVPEVYGWIDSMSAFVMTRVPGRPDFSDLTDEQRDVVVRQYVEALATIHRLDITPFAEAGIVRASSPEQSGLVGLARFEDAFRRQKNHPDPLIEFGLGFLRRHPLRSNGREPAIVWDSGQFHQQSGELVALVDLELGHLGDPMMDLAAWRMRDSILGFGRFDEIYAYYEKLVGEPVDLEAIKLHHFAFTMSNQLSFA